ncbi:signal peptidase II [Vallitalea guaymasensis]|uniref:Signal peptidase II n=1 Tax=Vallitalea guaymasensis TaxID=1185412 RepID=A0A8J8MF29_9FIRM|nr:signal peptidase II [Vallitalea guaymasensis]QUH31737.1 signal peptidase II [Vallitalea guaymasensis]
MLHFSKYKNLILIITFILLDQIIKILINTYWIDNYYDISNKIAIKPMLNKDYSYVNSTFGIDMSLQTHIILISLVLLVLIIIYKYILANNTNLRLLVLGLNLLIAGCICSLSDKFLWAGSLDYICVKGLLVLDLKDIYLIVAEIILIIWIIIKRDLVFRLNIRDIIRFVGDEWANYRMKNVIKHRKIKSNGK